MSSGTIEECTTLLRLLQEERGLCHVYREDKALAEAADLLAEWLSQLAEHSDRLRVVLIGEFNAGKSTVVNALLGKEVAFVDPFEATMCVAVYKPDSEEYAILKRGGTNQRLSLPEFVNLCSARSLADVELAEIHVQFAGEYLLYDTPGLSSLNERHEYWAEWAVKAADVLLWIIDPNDILSAKEGAFLIAAKRSGIPIRLILSKSDTLTSDEISEVGKEVESRLGYSETDLMVVSALTHTPSSPDAGIDALIRELGLLAEESSATKAAAHAAKTIEVVTECVRIIDSLLERNGSECEWLSAERDLIEKQAQAVMSGLLSDFEHRFRTALRKHLQRHLFRQLGTRVAENPGDLVENVIANFRTGEEQRLISEFVKSVHEEAKAMWNRHFAEREAELRRQIEALMEQGLEDPITKEFLADQLRATRARQVAVVRAFDSQSADDRLKQMQLAVLGGGAVAAIAAASMVPLLVGAVIAFGLQLGRTPRRADQSANSPSVEDVKREAEIEERFSAVLAEAAKDRISDPLIEFLNGIKAVALEEISMNRYGRGPDEIEQTRTVLLELRGRLADGGALPVRT